MKRWVTRWVVGLVVVALSACSPQRDIPETATVQSQVDQRERAAARAFEEENEGAITRALVDLERAVAQGDRATFAEFYAPGPARVRALLWFDTLEELPVEKVTFELGQPLGEATATELTALLFVGVELTGYDEGLVESQHRVDFELIDEQWQVVDDEYLTDISAAPWELEDVRVRVGKDVIVFGVTSNEDILDSWLATSEAAAEYVAEVVPYRWSGKVVVILPGSNAVVRDEGLSEIAKLGGVALPVDSVGLDESWMRVMIPPLSEQATVRGREALLRHEFTHVAVDDRIQHLPLWLSEGVAEWVGEEQQTLSLYDSYADRWYPNGPATAVIPDEKFHRGNWARSYSTAYFQVVWLARTEGADAPWRLITAFHKKQARTPSLHKIIMKETLGITPNEMAQQATQWMLDNSIPDR